MLNSGQNWRFYVPCDLEILMDDLGKQKGTSSVLHRDFCVIWKPWVNSNWSYSLETLNSVKIINFLSRVTLKFDGRPWTRQIRGGGGGGGGVSIAATGLVILLELDSNRRFFAHVNLKFDGWPQKNKARLLYNKVCVSFHIHQWIQTEVTVQKHPIWVKSGDFFSCMTLQFDVWPWKTIGHLFYATSSFVHHFVAIGGFKLEIRSGNAQFGSKLTIFRAVWPCNFTYDLEKQ